MREDQLFVDFGTSNSAAAYYDESKLVVVPFGPSDDMLSMPSVLLFRENPLKLGNPISYVGWDAEHAYEMDRGAARMISALKKYLADTELINTKIFNKSYDLHALVDLIFAKIKQRAEECAARRFRNLVLGRPVHFSTLSPGGDDDLAAGRLMAAARRVGFEEVELLEEPIAAAMAASAAGALGGLTMICDYGGGTSDFALLAPRGNRGIDILGADGVGLGGTNLDQKLVDNVIAPLLGSNSTYRTLDRKILPMPRQYYADLTWHRLPRLYAPKTIRSIKEIARTSSEPDRLELFLYIINEGVAHRLLRSVEDVKKHLSSNLSVPFDMEIAGRRLFREVKRQAFDAWIEPEREKLKSCMLRLVDRTGVDRLRITTVILTGGTASVPAVAGDVAETFPSAAVVRHDLSHAVVRGLALSRSLPYGRKTARATAS
jgi:hypothetical chaperone protein